MRVSGHVLGRGSSRATPATYPTVATSANHFWFGRSAANCRSGKFAGTVSNGRAFPILARAAAAVARKPCRRISRSIRCTSQSAPSASRSRRTRRAQKVQSLATKLALTLAAQLFVAAGSGAGRANQPGMKARPRRRDLLSDPEFHRAFQVIRLGQRVLRLLVLRAGRLGSMCAPTYVSGRARSIVRCGSYCHL